MPAGIKFILRYPFLCFLLIGCTSRDDKSQKQNLEDGFELSYKNIQTTCEQIIKAIEDKSYDPATKAKAEYWFPKASAAKTLCDDMNSYLQEKISIKDFSEEDYKDFFIKISDYEKKVMTIDSTIRTALGSSIILKASGSDYPEFKKKYFGKSSYSTRRLMIANFKNYVSVNEQKILAFCHSQIGSTIDFIDFFDAPIIGQNSKIFQPGEKIEITAGIGAFTTRIRPEILISGIKVNTSENGIAMYKSEVGSPGTHSVPVKFRYIDLDGKENVWEYNIKYIVRKPCD